MSLKPWFRAAATALVLTAGHAVAGAADGAVCNRDDSATLDDRIAACGRQISSGRVRGRDLAITYNSRGHHWTRKGEFDNAIADYGQAIAIDPKYGYADRGRAWYAKGMRHRSKGERENAAAALDRAMADADEAIRLDPNNSAAYNDRGMVWRAKGDDDRALADYSAAIRLDPRNAFAYANRGNVRRGKRDFDGAIADSNAALGIDSSYSAALTNRGLAYEAKGDSVRARADFSLAVAGPPRYDNDRWAQDMARARLALLSPAESSRPRFVVASRPGTPSPVTDGTKLALVIGNGAYAVYPLDNPPNDAQAVAVALREIGFEVIEGVNLDYAGMKRALVDFVERSSSARIALVYYAGHGVQIDGRNYLVPVDVKLVAKKTAAFDLFDIGELILRNLDDEARANIIILDACRNNPFETRTRSIAGGVGLAQFADVPAGMLIAFATKPGTAAEDGEGPHSPFTTALLSHLRTPGIDINEMLRRVRVDVFKATDRKQWPNNQDYLLGAVYLAQSP